MGRSWKPNSGLEAAPVAGASSPSACSLFRLKHCSCWYFCLSRVLKLTSIVETKINNSEIGLVGDPSGPLLLVFTLCNTYRTCIETELSSYIAVHQRRDENAAVVLRIRLVATNGSNYVHHERILISNRTLPDQDKKQEKKWHILLAKKTKQKSQLKPFLRNARDIPFIRLSLS